MFNASVLKNFAWSFKAAVSEEEGNEDILTDISKYIKLFEIPTSQYMYHVFPPLL